MVQWVIALVKLARYFNKHARGATAQAAGPAPTDALVSKEQRCEQKDVVWACSGGRYNWRRCCGRQQRDQAIPKWQVGQADIPRGATARVPALRLPNDLERGLAQRSPHARHLGARAGRYGRS